MIDVHNISTHCTRSEFVGTAVLDTIGLVISGIDDTLLNEMNIGTKYHCLGLFSSRAGAERQLTANDDAVTAPSTAILTKEILRAGVDMEMILFLVERMSLIYDMRCLWLWS